MNTRLLARLIASVTIISLVGVGSFAFFTRGKPAPYHHHIVNWALEMMGGFSTGLIDDLRHTTEAIDGTPELLWLDRWPDWAHYKNLPFDLPGIEIAWDVCREQRNDYRYRGAQHLGDGSITFRSYLGVLFHSAADFYAHTNWVKVKSSGDIADLEAEDPWPGLTNQGPGDWPSNPWFVESIYDAVLATIREWP